MALEITVNGSLAYADSEGADEALAPDEFQLTVVTKKYTKAKQTIGITEEAINLGEVSSLAYAIFVNRDVTNFIELRVATSGAKFAKLKPSGGFAILHMGSGAQVPYALADTAPCQMEYFLISQ